MITNKFSLIILILVIFVSCQKETQKATEQNNAATSLRKSPKSLFEAMSQLDFKEDFSIPPRENGEPHNIGPNDFGWSLRKASSSRDKAYLAETFTDAKTKVEDLFTRNKDDQHTATIQLVSLRYLRRYILETKSVESQKHVLDLLRILVETKAIDLDVLVDAYLFASPIIKLDEKQRFFDYITKVHDHDVAIIKEKAPIFMKAYKESTGNEQKKYLLWGKDLERRSNACAYAREKLPQLTVK